MLVKEIKTMKIWLFGTYKWHGNPKALFLYMTANCRNTHDCWWIADNKEDADSLKKQGIEKITYSNSSKASNLFARADVYVTENFRENYPQEIPEDLVIFNTWHGVGLKHIELALGEQSVLANGVVRKYIKNHTLYKDNTYFLATSQAMEEHFLEETVVKPNQIIRGSYPRNVVYSQNISTYDFAQVSHIDLSKANQVILFAPTYRITTIEGIFQYLLPDLEAIKQQMQAQNNVFIIKVHPFMTKDAYHQQMRTAYHNDQHILFWNDDYDIYEIFNQIDIAIIDYSSIFYDLLEAGVKRFVRYIPDYEEYISHSEFIGDYFSLTAGEIAKDFNSLLNILKHPLAKSSDLTHIQDYFFSYADHGSIREMIEEIDQIQVVHDTHKELHSFDIFDTLIRRKSMTPFSIFYYMQKIMLNDHATTLPTYVIDNWVRVRSQAEYDIRDAYAKTQLERNSDSLEITLDDIYGQLKLHLNLPDTQIDYLKQLEIDAEIEYIEPIPERIERLQQVKAAGHDVILMSDMYLPKAVIQAMLEKAAPGLLEIELYLSTEVGHQKSTGKLFKHVFFKNKYDYSRWVHYGDNIKADGTSPRRFNIQTFVHHPDTFIRFESTMIEAMSIRVRHDAYLLATKWQRFRTEAVKYSESNQEFDQKYYAYAYAGSALVPYVHWSILDALQRGYETLYFISRDGHFLKQIADQIIARKGYRINTRFIYGSRQAWRVPSYIDELDSEMFGGFGNFVGMDSFDDLVKASWISEQELLELFPQFATLKKLPHLRGETAENIRSILKNSPVYHQKVLKIAAERRELVCEYLKQNIDFNERFAFVEFWGRGYTQDVFARLLEASAGKTVDTNFYYARSFAPNKPNIHRHNFIVASKNFSYFEPIFASTPYRSITEYYQDQQSGKVNAVIIPQPNDMAAVFEEQFSHFIQDYLDVVTTDNMQFIYELANFSYDYQLKNHNDQFICSVFASLKDNISSYGETREYAPAITLKQLQAATSKQDLDKLTTSIAISLARSKEDAYQYYQKVYAKMKFPKVSSGLSRRVYAVNDLSDYVYAVKPPFQACCIKNNALYTDVSFNEDTKRTDMIFPEGKVFDVIAIEWLKNGVPRLVTREGYLTAHKQWVAYYGIPPTSESKKQNVPQKLQDKHKKTKEKFNHATAKITELESEPSSRSIKSRKLNKFRRNPYLFFRDSKNPATRVLQYCFNEQHFVGKLLSNLIRRYL
ncbi:CDP-glycerol glycerophosphotransferase family protein [Testudinibacter sp. TR-2022]|uniref:CDP-glycerol glycerophosphotransferase family protein n=1 Tax=Testudinibacter sp. TR-2022 TaxID=2585029 RepID=UPI002279692F|nr:CDP-glycerol glycerophosphotransferase family protein [Testudinibacter sp. TR-2022]